MININNFINNYKSLFISSNNDNIINNDMYHQYNIAKYHEDIQINGLRKTWEFICKGLLLYGETQLITIKNLGELYEDGLALYNKLNKKENGQYYTPIDVALVMSEWFDNIEGENICDVGCGVGNLILAYFNFIGKEKSIQIIQSKKLYLYDNDEIALWICITSLLLKYGIELVSYINVVCDDFLDISVCLPKNCKVISNPPYAKIKTIKNNWEQNNVINDSRELYSAFMAKILKYSNSAVIITPYSFIGGKKFYSLRYMMNEKGGFILSFDNVPDTIFRGRKHGIFNSNTSNAVRAAISVLYNSNDKGIQVSPLIRFNHSERKQLLQCSILKQFLGTNKQIISEENKSYIKCAKQLEHIYKTWVTKSNSTIGLNVDTDGEYMLYIPNTCRYFTVASTRHLCRTGQLKINFYDEYMYWYVFCIVNSSFAYWYWRMFDGGITFSKTLLLSIPLFYSELSIEDKNFCKNIAQEMIETSTDFITYKKNKGNQENIKYPRKYRDLINARFFKILGITEDVKIFDMVKSSSALNFL